MEEIACLVLGINTDHLSSLVHFLAKRVCCLRWYCGGIRSPCFRCLLQRVCIVEVCLEFHYMLNFSSVSVSLFPNSCALPSCIIIEIAQLAKAKINYNSWEKCYTFCYFSFSSLKLLGSVCLENYFSRKRSSPISIVWVDKG